MHRSQFLSQNSLQMANTIKNWISLNFRESEKNEKVTRNDLRTFFAFFYSSLVTKMTVGTSKNVDGIFSEIFNFDRKSSRSCSVILGTVQHR